MVFSKVNNVHAKLAEFMKNFKKTKNSKVSEELLASTPSSKE